MRKRRVDLLTFEVYYSMFEGPRAWSRIRSGINCARARLVCWTEIAKISGDELMEESNGRIRIRHIAGAKVQCMKYM